MLQQSCPACLASSMRGAPRAPQENNFKAVLESIRDLMNEETVMPAWLHDIFLGYGDPAAARYTNLPDTLGTIDFKDTFLDAAHLRASFPGHAVEFARAPAAPGGAQANGSAHMDVDGEAEEPRPPFRVTFARAPAAAAPAAAPKTGKRKVAVVFRRARRPTACACTSPLEGLCSHTVVRWTGRPGGRRRRPGGAARRAAQAAGGAVPAARPGALPAGQAAGEHRALHACAGAPPALSLMRCGWSPLAAAGARLAADQAMRLGEHAALALHADVTGLHGSSGDTALGGQVEAIRAGVQPGLTMVVGPPGTGKTDTAVQVMHVLYHNCPGQRTLLITHSNQARALARGACTRTPPGC